MSNLFRDIAPRMVSDRYDAPTFSVALLQKDNRLALELARAVGAPTFLADSVDLLNTVGVNTGLSGLDTSSLYCLYRDLSPAPREG